MDIHSTVALRTGNEMPIIGLGTWQLTKDTPTAIASALASGYRMIDTSGDYRTQPGIAEGIKKSGIDRGDLYITTKVEETDDAYRATQTDLKELQTGYANLMLIHRPPRSGFGADLWQGLIRAKREGLARDIGVSNYSIQQLSLLIGSSDEIPAVNQIEWSPFGFSTEMFDFCRENGIVIQAYSPLTRGRRLDDPGLSEIAGHYGKTPAQLLLRWNLQSGTVPLPKANQSTHQQENLDVFDFEITDQDMDALAGRNGLYSALGSKPQYM